MTVSIEDPQVNAFIFHPRREMSGPSDAAVATVTEVEGAVIGGYLHPNKNSDTLVLFFHGNGEIAADYGALAHLYTGCGASFWVVDYRGYGRSTGAPSYTRMRSDAEAVLADLPALEAASEIRFGRIVVMGRSLGSASAIHLAAVLRDRVHGLVLDSPFADGPALIRRLGGPEVDPALTPGFEDNIDQMKTCSLPVLIIHGTEDWIIPISDAEALYDACPSAEKRLVKIRGAGHNDLLVQGYGTYFSAIRSFLESIRPANR
ncbi:MAG: alpha/beta fold hydrolase [Desulfobacterales bacterium]|jgi:pimeloyl-ACP methyl ester carboxylesterase